MEDIYSYVSRNVNGSSAYLDVVSDVVDRIEFEGIVEGNYDFDSEVSDAIDNGLIYTDDQWTILKEFCDPQDADWDMAFENFYNDVYVSAQAALEDAEEEYGETEDEDEADYDEDDIDDTEE